MRKTTKILSLLLTLAMMLTMVFPVTASASFTDVPSNHPYYEAITNLSSEGILNGMGDGTFDPEGPVTRAQFTKIICYALSVGNITYSESERSIFTDLAPDHWAANNIVTAYRQGIINGMGDGTFAPEAGVQYEQAVKMVVCALGYPTQRADALGGYPAGYMSIANSAKILKGITDCKIGEVMNRGAVAKLMDNFMDADQISEGVPSGSIRDESIQVKQYSGQVVSSYEVALYDYVDSADARCNRDQIAISNAQGNIKKFDVSNISNFDIDKYIGRSVTVFYEEESGIMFASSLTLQAKRNKEVTIDLSMIEDYDGTKIEYWKNENATETETISYESSSNNFLNGAATGDTIEEILDADGNVNKTGTITLICSDTGSTADVAFIKTYQMMVVSSRNTTTNMVYGKNAPFTGGIELDVESRTKDVTITSDGKTFALSSLQQNDILLISQSAGSIEVLVSRKTAKGTITEKTPDGKIKLDSGNTLYSVSVDCVIQDMPSGTIDDVPVGKHVTVSLDAFGKIARVEFTAEATYQYGYLADLRTGTSSDDEIYVRIYTAKSNNSTLRAEDKEIAKKVKINGETYIVEDEKDIILDKLDDTADNASDFASAISPTVTDWSQPIRYTLDSAGKINAILTKTATGENTTSLNLLHFTDGGEDIDCTVSGSTFGEYRISSSTPIIYIPQDRIGGTYRSYASGIFTKGTEYYVQFANINTGLVGCVYYYGTTGGDETVTITKDTVPMIVTDITNVSVDVSTKKFELADVITGKTIECYDNNIAGTADLLVGDVVRVAYAEEVVEGREEPEKFIEVLEILADAEEVVAGTFDYGTGVYVKTQGEGSGIGYDFRVLIGAIKTKASDSLNPVAGYDTTATPEAYGLSSSTPIYVVDTAANVANRITSGATIDEIATDGHIMLYTVDAQIKAVIYFK